MKKANDKLAQERLDRARLEMLADREKHLAEQAAELAAKHPVVDPSAKPQAEKIKREQAEVAAELERLAQQSEPLKQAREQARAEQAQQMAERARDMAQAQCATWHERRRRPSGSAIRIVWRNWLASSSNWPSKRRSWPSRRGSRLVRRKPCR